MDPRLGYAPIRRLHRDGLDEVASHDLSSGNWWVSRSIGQVDRSPEFASLEWAQHFTPLSPSQVSPAQQLVIETEAWANVNDSLDGATPASDRPAPAGIVWSLGMGDVYRHITCCASHINPRGIGVISSQHALQITTFLALIEGLRERFGGYTSGWLQVARATLAPGQTGEESSSQRDPGRQWAELSARRQSMPGGRVRVRAQCGSVAEVN